MNKICLKCNVNYDVTFYASGRNVCKSCRALQQKERTKINIEEIDYTDLQKTKKCCKCTLELNVSFFNINRNFKSGYSSQCKKCYSETRKNIKKQRNNNEINPNPNIKHKTCVRCKNNKDVENYKITSRTMDGYFPYCKDCTPETTWTKEKQKESEKKYIAKNPDKIREKWKRQGKNINRRVRDSLNHRISEALQTQNLTKNNKTFNYVGCSRDELKKWFEYNFENGMSWDNYGEWHIDHVMPCSLFDLSREDDKLNCFSWKNLRPCWAYENITKGNKIIDDVINEHNEKLLNFINSTTKL